MMMKQMAMVVIAAAALALVGCGDKGPRMGRYDIVLTAEEGAIRASKDFVVDLVAVAPEDKGRMEGVDLAKWFDPADPDRLRSAMLANGRSFSFNESQPREQKLSKDDPIWGRWKSEKRDSLYVLASLPGGGVSPDPRRRMIPLTTDKYTDESRINVVLAQGSVEVTAPNVAPAKK